MKEVLQRLYEYEILDEAESCSLLYGLVTGEVPASQVSSLLSVYLMRPPALDELKGFRRAMLGMCLPADFSGYQFLDIVGTGGDGKNTFNISTLSAFVAAGAGIRVVKHGNYAAGSVSGSSDVLEYLGYRFTNDHDVLRRQLESVHICFLHAPLFHPAMKSVASVRRELGVRTFFNLLGPVINPARPAAQMLGVSHPSWMRLYQYLFEDAGQQYQIIHSLDGYDEISLTGAFKWVSNSREQVYCPEDIGFAAVVPEALTAGRDVASAAAIFLAILEGRGTTAQQDVVVANSGFAIHCLHPERDLATCIAQARESLCSGRALQVLRKVMV